MTTTSASMSPGQVARRLCGKRSYGHTLEALGAAFGTTRPFDASEAGAALRGLLPFVAVDWTAVGALFERDVVAAR